MLFPAPPEVPRIQFLRSFSGSSDLETESPLSKFLNITKTDFKIINKPYGIATGNGKIYICDSYQGTLDIIDLTRNTLRIFTPLGFGALRKPINAALDSTGNLYITDTQRGDIVVFGPDLSFKKSIKGESLKPVDVDVRGDSVYIADMKDKNVEIWSASGNTKVADFPPPREDTPDSLRLIEPVSLAVDKERNVYVCDFGAFCVRKYDHEGKLIRTFGTLGKSSGQFARPKGITVDDEERLYVVDAAFENVQIFDKDGNLLLFFGGPYARPGNMYLPAQITIDYQAMKWFEPYVLPGFKLQYLLFVTNQFGPDKIGVYGFLTSASGETGSNGK